MKIFITRKIPDIGIKMLKYKGYIVDINPKDRILSHKELINILKKGNYDAVICLITDKIDASVFRVAPSVKLYANYATGYDNIDVFEAKKRSIQVSNAPTDLSADAVAQHSVALMFALMTRTVEADDFVRHGKYKEWCPMEFIGTDFTNKTLGLVGAGRIGGRVGQYCKALGMKVIYTDVSRNTKIEQDCGAQYFSSIDELLKNSDVISVHVPLLDSTRHLINEKRIKLMKSTSFIINTARGPIIDEKALVKALKKKAIGGAGLDVYEFEPKLSPGLSKLPNVVLTPHIASASIEARDQMSATVAENVISFFETGKVKNPAN